MKTTRAFQFFRKDYNLYNEKEVAKMLKKLLYFNLKKQFVRDAKRLAKGHDKPDAIDYVYAAISYVLSLGSDEKVLKTKETIVREVFANHISDDEIEELVKELA